MPITHVIDRFRQRMWTKADGFVTLTDIMAHLDAEARDRGIDLPELIDASNATTNLTPHDVRLLVHRVRDMVRAQPFGPTALVSTDDMAFGMARMFSILVEPARVVLEVFRDVARAEAWLDQASGPLKGGSPVRPHPPKE
jgi:hypothetical protein